MKEVAQPRIVELGFKATIGLFTGIAFSLALGRTYIRIFRTRTVNLDDAFFFLAVITLIAGTTTLYFTIPYLYVQKHVDPDSTVITPEFIALLQRCMRLQLATNMLLSVTLFANGIFNLWVFLDILTDGLRKSPLPLLPQFWISSPDKWISDSIVITIPIAILWRIRIGLRGKLCLGAILCLSVFTMAVSVVRIAGASLPSGFIDDIWTSFWLHVEAAVAVVVVSSSTYRSLYVQHGRKKRAGRGTADNSHSRRKLLLWRGKEKKGAMLLPSLKAPDPVLGGVRAAIERVERGSEERLLERESGSVEIRTERGQGEMC
ncbi:MAG: hypothetical protein LQ345_003610 [Seirophora villosa]|nr:MAG: hypothetical protein LQ345_003610 [Seirophora villosa]